MAEPDAKPVPDRLVLPSIGDGALLEPSAIPWALEPALEPAIEPAIQPASQPGIQPAIQPALARAYYEIARPPSRAMA